MAFTVCLVVAQSFLPITSNLETYRNYIAQVLKRNLLALPLKEFGLATKDKINTLVSLFSKTILVVDLAPVFGLLRFCP